MYFMPKTSSRSSLLEMILLSAFMFLGKTPESTSLADWIATLFTTDGCKCMMGPCQTTAATAVWDAAWPSNTSLLLWRARHRFPLGCWLFSAYQHKVRHINNEMLVAQKWRALVFYSHTITWSKSKDHSLGPILREWLLLWTLWRVKRSECRC